MESNKRKMDIFKSKRRFAFLSYILGAIFMVGSIVLNTIAFSDESFIVQDKEMSALFYNLSNQNVSRFYVNSVFLNNEKRSAETMYRSVYTKNLSNDGYQHIISVSNNNSILKSTTYFGDEKLPFSSSITSSLVYTNKKDPPSFETLLINLFQYRERSEEISYDTTKYSGFIYIPDYYADYIIEHNENFSTYSDLYKNENSISFVVNNKKYDYKIANIFCVNGFKKEHCGDVEPNVVYDHGKLFYNFLTDFCVISSISTLTSGSEDLHLSVVSVLTAKRFLLIDTLRAVENTLKKNSDNANINLFYQNGEAITYYKNSSQLANAFLHHQSRISRAFKITSISIFVLSSVLLLFLFFKFYLEKSFYIFSLVEFGSLVFVLLLFSIFKRTSLALSISAYYSSATAFAIVVYLLLLIIILSSALIGKKEDK